MYQLQSRQEDREQTPAEKITLIRGRFKSTKDLHVFMTERRKYHLTLAD